MKKLIILMAVCTGSYAMAQNTPSDPSGSGTSGRVENQASDFIKKAAMIDKMEIAAGKIAQEKALHPQVKSFGDMMISEHTKSSVELRTLGNKNTPAKQETGSNMGSSSGGYMGTQGQNSNYNTSASSNRTNMGSYNSSRGNTNRNLPISQTTPSTKYSEGTQTNWNSRDASKASNRANTSGTSNSSSNYNNGQRMNRDATNTNRTTADEMTMSTDISSSGTNSTTQNAGIETNGTIKSGTASGTMNTGTINGTINSETNNGTMDSGTSSTNRTTGTATGTTNSGTNNSNMNTGTSSTTQNTGTNSGTMNTGTTNGTINSGTNNSNMDTGTSSTTGNTGTTGGTTNSGTNNGTMGTGTSSTTGNTGTTSGTMNSGTNNGTMDTGTSSTTLSTGTTSGTVNSGSTTGSLNTGTGINTQDAGIGMNNDMNMTQMQDDHMNKLGTLSGMTGAEFDRAYMDMMVSDHTKAIQLYESASRSSDAEISAFATRMLPALRKHFEQAKSISTTVKSSTSGL